jgi:hypothetical protein
MTMGTLAEWWSRRRGRADKGEGGHDGGGFVDGGQSVEGHGEEEEAVSSTGCRYDPLTGEVFDQAVDDGDDEEDGGDDGGDMGAAAARKRKARIFAVALVALPLGFFGLTTLLRLAGTSNRADFVGIPESAPVTMAPQVPESAVGPGGEVQAPRGAPTVTGVRGGLGDGAAASNGAGAQQANVQVADGGGAIGGTSGDAAVIVALREEMKVLIAEVAALREDLRSVDRLVRPLGARLADVMGAVESLRAAVAAGGAAVKAPVVEAGQRPQVKATASIPAPMVPANGGQRQAKTTAGKVSEADGGRGAGCVLRSAGADSALISDSADGDVRGVRVGSDDRCLGRVTAITQAGGRWTVVGSRGTARQ